MAKFIVTLKQHTPLIHFQAAQDSATIRATELKPKLDKFLKEYAFKHFDLYKNYLIGEQKDSNSKIKALDYKVRICNLVNNKVEDIEKSKTNKKGKKIPVNFPLFFGNTGIQDDDYKKKFTYCDTLDVEFMSFHDELISKIRDYFPEFLIRNNFGTRQSKGFGSFFLNEKNEYYYNGTKGNYNKNLNKKLKYMFSVKVNSANKYEVYKEVFDKIELFYKSMRSGLDFNKVDPLVKYYFEKQGLVWDKEVIKLRYRKRKNIDNIHAVLGKDLFGLSSRESWGKLDCITKEHSCDSQDKEIERFKSPIFFKPIQISKDKYNIYFEANDISKEFLGQEFIIKNNNKDGFKLKTPDKFDFEDFFKFMLESSHHHKAVRAIYDEIKENLRKVVK